MGPMGKKSSGPIPIKAVFFGTLRDPEPGLEPAPALSTLTITPPASGLELLLDRLVRKRKHWRFIKWSVRSAGDPRVVRVSSLGLKIKSNLNGEIRQLSHYNRTISL